MFIGRKCELGLLKKAYQQKKSLLIVCSGRRRIGKSTLIEAYGKSFSNFYEFQGLHPKEAPKQQQQLEHFANRLRLYFNRPKMIFSSWIEAFAELDHLLPSTDSLLFLDEISWMGTDCPTFSAQLKDAWDTLFKKHPHLVVAIAGSVSSWIQENILENTNFLGRVSIHILLEELPLQVLKQFWGQRAHLVSNYDFMRTIAMTGGVPRYLEDIDPKESPEENIKRLCFTPSGFMVDEYEKIFSDTFSRRGPIYQKIVTTLLESRLNLSGLAAKLKIGKSGSLSRYLDDLVKSGFLAEDTTFDFSGKPRKNVTYRVRDNYIRFALKYIDPKKKRILAGDYQLSSLELLPGWRTMMGLQFENIILANRTLILEKLQILPQTVIACSPYLQKKTAKNKGSCQIDLMIVTSSFQIYVCEIKFGIKIQSNVIQELENKIRVLYRPRHYTIHPVLIYGGELAPTLHFDETWQILSIDDLVNLNWPR